MTAEPKAASATKKARRGQNITVWVALVLALVAGGANYQYVRSLEGSRVTMLKAKSRLPVGTRVTSAMFDKIPISGKLEDMRALFVDDSSLALFSQLPLAETLKTGQPLMQSDFEPSGTKGACHESIKAGDRAIPLPADEVSTHSYSVGINTVVDVFVEPGGKVIGPVPVCALDGQTTVRPGARYNTLSIMVRADQVASVVSQTRGNGKQITFAVLGPAGQ